MLPYQRWKVIIGFPYQGNLNYVFLQKNPEIHSTLQKCNITGILYACLYVDLARVYTH